MSFLAKYIFKNDKKGQMSVLVSAIDNAPTSASSKIKEALINYGSSDFDPKTLAEVFATVNSYSFCEILNSDDTDVNDEFTYLVETGVQKRNNRPDLKVTIFKNNKLVFEDTFKKFLEKSVRLEKTFVAV
jgi:hypothetical protein